MNTKIMPHLKAENLRIYIMVSFDTQAINKMYFAAVGCLVGFYDHDYFWKREHNFEAYTPIALKFWLEFQKQSVK